MAPPFTEKQLDKFFKAASSLKLFSRAELNDDNNRTLIEKLYVDPLPNDQAFKTLLGDNTTIIIGRKGTGKSTVFQRVQHEIRKNNSNIISAYMDIRNVYESSQIDQLNVENWDQHTAAMTQDQAKKFLLYKGFIYTLIHDIRNELKTQVERSFLSRIRERVMGTSAEVFAGLDGIIEKIKSPIYENIDSVVLKSVKVTNAKKTTHAKSVSGEAGASLEKVGATAKGNLGTEVANESGVEEVYTQQLMQVTRINDVMQELRQILNAINIRYLYIFLDDFSELPKEAMQILVDTLISPLTRWSDFIKFKIAAYPGRIYLGSLDKTKIEEFHLDIYGLYGASAVSKMEEKATDFVKRLVEKRMAVFCNQDADFYFNTRSSDDVWKVLYYASAANPRILGHIMLYAHESHLLYGNKIGLQAIQEAAQKYYDEKVAVFFRVGMYQVAFRERSSVYSLKELLESIVMKARNIKHEERIRDARGGKSRVFSSHFYVLREYEDLLTSLELAFFITKHFEQSDRDGARVSIYALNYGLCAKYQISFGRPADRREDRLYFVERVFDYNSVIRAYMLKNQEISCGYCDEHFDMTNLEALKIYSMRCPKCHKGVCQVVNLSRKYGDLINSISPELLLPEAELGILQTLHSENRIMVAAEIAGELDCSGQLVGRRAKNLAERTLVRREQAGQVYNYKITPQAEAAYFNDPRLAALDVWGDANE